jgi:predicted nucleic acid-binding protein
LDFREIQVQRHQHAIFRAATLGEHRIAGNREFLVADSIRFETRSAKDRRVFCWIEPVEVHFQWRPQSRDPNDEMVLEAAINGRADALVTYNVADFAGPAERFRISVLRPGDLLKKVKP